MNYHIKTQLSLFIIFSKLYGFMYFIFLKFLPILDFGEYKLLLPLLSLELSPLALTLCLSVSLNVRIDFPSFEPKVPILGLVEIPQIFFFISFFLPSKTFIISFFYYSPYFSIIDSIKFKYSFRNVLKSKS